MLKSRRREEQFFKTLMILALSVVLASLGMIIIVIMYKGISSLSLSMLFQTPKGGYYLGKEGGIANAIIGSVLLAGGAAFLSLFISIPVAFALQREFLKPFFAKTTRLSLDILWGVPSIVFGAFGFIIMRYFGLGASLLGGIIVLSLIMIPILIRAIDEVIRMVPPELKEVAYALGATRYETSWGVVLRQVTPGIVMGLMLAFGRGIGDAASILFTAGYTDYLPCSLLEPVASLPLAVFFMINTPLREVQNRAYAAAFVLLVIVLSASLLSRFMTHRLSKNIIK
jgi:phosphate transport system permease protein